MAFVNWLHLGLQLVHDLSHFLLFGAPVGPNLSTHAPTVVPTTSPAEDVTATIQSTLVEASLRSIAGWLGFSLPQAVTVVTGLPVATVFLLRLTEVWPAEFLLFLCLSGLVAWAFAFVFMTVISLWLVVRIVKRCCCAHRRPQVPVVTFAPDQILTPDTEDTPPSSPTHFPQVLPASVAPPVLDHTGSTPRASLSDAALTLTDTVAAHHSAITLATAAQSRPRRSSSRPTNKVSRKHNAAASPTSA